MERNAYQGESSAMKPLNLFRTYVFLFIGVVALTFAAACGATSPTEPSPTSDPAPAPAPSPSPAPAPAPGPSGPGRLAIEVNPNPVPYSGQPVGCNSDRPHTWRYDQVLRNVGGTRFTLTRRANYFDGNKISEPDANITIEPGQSSSVTTSWCSTTNAQHTARTDWFGSDAAGNKVDLPGPTITLSPR
jgi:hypothetical protein